MRQTFTGTRDGTGEWRPPGPMKLAPIFFWPWKPLVFLRYLFGRPGYFLPWGLFYMAFPVATWFFLTPPLESFQALTLQNAALLYGRNLVLVVLTAGAFHLYHYVWRAQGTDYKYAERWLAENAPRFLFSSQTLDNLFWIVVSAVPVWTAFEMVTLWGYANGYLPYVDWREHPVYCVLLFALVPVMRDFHFYLIHRAIHWPPLYKRVHYLHHKNVNIGPFSGLAMHPVEHFVYWTGVLVHWIVPSHPLHALFHLQHAGLTPAKGHTGFDRTVLPNGVELTHGNYFHYLHHKYFECNYGGDDAKVPMDRWFGSFVDGSEESVAALKARRSARLG